MFKARRVRFKVVLTVDSHMNVCMKGVTSGPSYYAAKLLADIHIQWSELFLLRVYRTVIECFNYCRPL